MSFIDFEYERNVRYLLQNAKLLERRHLSVEAGRNLVEVLFLRPVHAL